MTPVVRDGGDGTSSGRTRSVHERAEMLLEVGRTDEAIRILERLLTEEPEQADTLVLLARTNLAAGRKLAADRASRAALAIEPENVAARCVHALTADALGRADAVEHAEAAVATDPEFWFGHAVLGLVLANTGRYADAAEAAGRAVALAPEEAQAHAMAGDAALVAGRLDEAERAYRLALGLSPEHAVARHNLGVVRMRRAGSLAAGLTDVAEAAALDPTMPESRHLLDGYARTVVVRTGWTALRCGLAGLAGAALVLASDAGTGTVRLLAGLLALVVSGWLVGVLLRTPRSVRPMVRRAVLARRSYWSGPASALVTALTLVGYAGTGHAVVLTPLVLTSVAGAVAARRAGEDLRVDR